MKIAIVGNGISASFKKNGEFIDSCDIVVRMNRFYYEGWEEYVGSKIDVISLMITGEGVTAGILGFDPLLKCVPLAREIWIPDKYRLENEHNQRRAKDHFRLKDNFKFVSPNVYDDLFNKMINISNALEIYMDYYFPDSGMTNIEKVIKEYSEAEIYVTGFDPNRRYEYKYYWEKDIQKTEAFNEHPQIAEGVLFEHYKRIGRIKEL